MSRRNTGGILALIDIAEQLPPWLGFSLAIGAYFFFGSYASDPEFTSGPAGNMIQAFYIFLQYGCSLALFLGAVLALFRTLAEWPSSKMYSGDQVRPNESKADSQARIKFEVTEIQKTGDSLPLFEPAPHCPSCNSIMIIRKAGRGR
jgi:hypothetical protein